MFRFQDPHYEGCLKEVIHILKHFVSLENSLEYDETAKEIIKQGLKAIYWAVSH
jgi:hypothetical protein